MTLMLIFGGLALVLGAIGIYGVIAYASTQRREEFATRIALGASAGRIFRLVLAGGQQLTAIGVVRWLDRRLCRRAAGRQPDLRDERRRPTCADSSDADRSDASR